MTELSIQVEDVNVIDRINSLTSSLISALPSVSEAIQNNHHETRGSDSPLNRAVEGDELCTIFNQTTSLLEQYLTKPNPSETSSQVNEIG